jgi:hypothetical protein
LFGDPAVSRKSGRRNPTKLGPTMIIVMFAVAEPNLFVAVTVPAYVPTLVGVPENIPVAVSNITPGHDTVVPQLNGLLPLPVILVATTWYVNAIPTV